MNNLRISCRLKNVILERGNGFKLAIPYFTIPVQTDGIMNKIPLMGISGAGKSTLLNLIAGIEWPQGGEISWMFPDEDSPHVSWSKDGPPSTAIRKLRRKFFGYAFQDSTLMEHLSVEDNLCYPLLLKGFSTKEAHSVAGKTLKKVLIGKEKHQIADFLSRFPFQLSGGQRQRVALVQAMIHNPYVLFADEPTGSLDAATRQEVMDVLYGWADEPEHRGKRLLVWVTHHEDDPVKAKVHKFLHIQSGENPCWKQIKHKSGANVTAL